MPATLAAPAAPCPARAWVDLYQRRGYQPLPSDATPGARKKPLVKFAQWWECAAPADLWDRCPSTNIQVMTGRHWGLAVLDLDGPEAIEHIARNWPKLPRTWEVTSGGGGRHLWFSLHRGLPEKRKTVLWAVWDGAAKGGQGDWAKHKAVELLCDRSLVMAPPSVHPETGRVYRFEAGRSPKEIHRPAPLPAWIWGMPPVVAPRPAVEPLPPVAPADRVPVRVSPHRGRGADWQHVLDAIPDKAAVARSWGLRFAASPAESGGWVSCHDFNRDDANPSARFHLALGRFWRPGEKTLSLFDLGVQLGAFAEWSSCVNGLAEQFNVS